MKKASVYYCKGSASEESVSSVFVDPAFEISEATFDKEKVSYDDRLRQMLGEALTDPEWQTFIFLRRLDEKGRSQAEKFASDVLAAGTTKTIFVENGDFSAISIPRAEVPRVQGELERGGAIFDCAYHSSATDSCLQSFNIITMFVVFASLTVLILVAPYANDKSSRIFFWVVAFLFFVAIIFPLFWSDTVVPVIC